MAKAIEQLEATRNTAEAGGERVALAAKEAEAELAALRLRLSQQDAALRSHERASKEAAKTFEAARAAEERSAAACLGFAAAARESEADLSKARSKVAALEQAVRSKEQDLLKMAKQSEADRAQAEAALTRAEARAGEAAAKLETALAQARSRISLLESASAARDKEVEGLQRMVDSARAEAAAAGAPSSSRGGGGGEIEGGELLGESSAIIRRLEGELLATKSRLVHLEHVARTRSVGDALSSEDCSMRRVLVRVLGPSLLFPSSCVVPRPALLPSQGAGGRQDPRRAVRQGRQGGAQGGEGQGGLRGAQAGLGRQRPAAGGRGQRGQGDGGRRRRRLARDAAGRDRLAVRQCGTIVCPPNHRSSLLAYIAYPRAIQETECDRCFPLRSPGTRRSARASRRSWPPPGPSCGCWPISCARRRT